MQKHVSTSTTTELIDLVGEVEITEDFSIFQQRSEEEIEAHNQFFRDVASSASLIHSIGTTMNFWRFKLYYFFRYKDLSLFLKMQSKDLGKFLQLLCGIIKKVSDLVELSPKLTMLCPYKGDADANRKAFYKEFKSFPRHGYGAAISVVFEGKLFAECHNYIISTVKLLENLKLRILDINQVSKTVDEIHEVFRGKGMQNMFFIFTRWIYSDLKDAEKFKSWMDEGILIDSFFKLYDDGEFCEESKSMHFDEESIEGKLVAGACGQTSVLDMNLKNFYKSSLITSWDVAGFTSESLLAKYILRRKILLHNAIVDNNKNN